MPKIITDRTIKRIRELVDMGMEQKAVAKALGISQGTVSKYTRNRFVTKASGAPKKDKEDHRSYGQRKAAEFIAAGGAKVDIDPAWLFDQKRKKQLSSKGEKSEA